MTNANPKIMILPGDGIGPEVVRQALRILEWLEDNRGLHFELQVGEMGGATYEAHGTPLTDETLAQIYSADAILFGAIGGPKQGEIPIEIQRKRGLLFLRRELRLFANLRPIRVFDSLIDASTLKPDVIRDVDLLIVRELTGGVYFGEPRGIETLADGSRRGVNTHVYSSAEIQRIARLAFDLARRRTGKLCSVDKSNVMESGRLWREEVGKLQSSEFEDVELSHMLADNCAMQLVRHPRQFDVIVTDNLFGDILSDGAAMIASSLGMLPSASLGAHDEQGKSYALYEPVHGSAPDIAGKDLANPLGAILSLALMLRYSFNSDSEAERVEAAIDDTLDRGLRTGDIMQPGRQQVSTTEMGDAILRSLDKRG